MSNNKIVTRNHSRPIKSYVRREGRLTKSQSNALDNLWIKNDSLNPTFSFKDRVVSIASNKAKEFEMTTLACASTGNLAGSVAAHGAKGGLETVVFIPKNLEKEKIISAGVYNPKIVTVDGTYDDVNLSLIHI